jgi:hypothetical protein
MDGRGCLTRQELRSEACKIVGKLAGAPSLVVAGSYGKLGPAAVSTSVPVSEMTPPVRAT